MNFFKTYIKEHFALYTFVFTIWLAAVMVGIYIAMSSADSQAKDIASYIQSILNTKNSFWAVFKNGIGANFRFVIFLCISSSFVIFLPICAFLIGFKGFSAGFTASFIIRLYGLKGMGVTITTVVLPLFFSLPFLFMMFTMSLNFPIETFRLRKQISSSERWRMQLSYLAKMLVLFVFLIIVTMFEAFLSPYMFSILTK